MIERNGKSEREREREREKSMLAAQHDDDNILYIFHGGICDPGFHALRIHQTDSM